MKEAKVFALALAATSNNGKKGNNYNNCNNSSNASYHWTHLWHQQESPPLSCTCKDIANGHQDTATADNKMGGSTRNWGAHRH
jgi:hypothetical protein